MPFPVVKSTTTTYLYPFYKRRVLRLKTHQVLSFLRLVCAVQVKDLLTKIGKMFEKKEEKCNTGVARKIKAFLKHPGGTLDFPRASHQYNLML